MKLISIISIIILLSGCTIGNRIKGGHSAYTSTTGAKIELAQSQDPKSASGYKTEIETKKEYVIPAGSKIILDDTARVDGITTPTNAFILISSNTPVRVTTKEVISLEQGAAQKNSYQDIAAKLNSMRPVQFVGIALLIFGVASFVYPPLRLLIASVTTSIVISVTGFGLIVLPLIIVGNETLILLAGVGLSLGYLFVHRYGKTSGEAKLLKQWHDDNNNNTVDDGEIR